MKTSPLKHERLRTYCNPDHLGFETTAELKKPIGIIGQTRARNAIQFGIAIKKPGYNIYALGPHGVGKHSIVQALLNQSSKETFQSSDWCYVYNFNAHQAPSPLELPAGLGLELRNDMDHLIECLQVSIPVVAQALAHTAIETAMQPLQKKYHHLDQVLNYLDAVEEDITNNLQNFYLPEEGKDFFIRYKVNIIINNNKQTKSPVVYESNPTYPNLIGRFEQTVQLGTLTTDFTLIRPGALHRANEGYLILDAHRILSHPQAWEGLKRSLYSQQIEVSPLEEMLGTPSSITLKPTPIPLKLKIILLGDRELYNTLYSTDPDFRELFKVIAEFEEEIERNPKNDKIYAQLIASLIHKESLRPFHKSAVALLVDHSARLTGDAQCLTTHYRGISDLLCEVDFFAGAAKHATAQADDVQQAINNQISRVNYLSDKLDDDIKRGFILIDTDGECVGQVNGIAVVSLGDFDFGQPSRITATACFGENEILDIEREVELGEATHSKGILILSSYLRRLYARNKPLSLSASLAFEQNYDLIEGDSASMGELCALLSAIADIPIKQGFAITGSINQQGQTQAVGNVNEKIEGFFNLCQSRGLTGEQGVLIPAANVKQLMLREEVVRAAENQQFHIYPIKTIDQAIAILTGMPAGQRNKEGKYPENSFNFRVEKVLENFAALAKEKDD